MSLTNVTILIFFFFFQAEDGIRDHCVTGVQTCALPIYDGQRGLRWDRRGQLDVRITAGRWRDRAIHEDGLAAVLAGNADHLPAHAAVVKRSWQRPARATRLTDNGHSH